MAIQGPQQLVKHRCGPKLAVNDGTVFHDKIFSLKFPQLLPDIVTVPHILRFFRQAVTLDFSSVSQERPQISRNIYADIRR